MFFRIKYIQIMQKLKMNYAMSQRHTQNTLQIKKLSSET